MNAQFPDEETKSGEFKRQEDAFRDGSQTTAHTLRCRGRPLSSLRFVGLPWASRTVIVRKLKGLEDAIGLTVVDPIRDDLGWAFRDTSGEIPPARRLNPPIRSTASNF
jgi:Predicted glutathione S-transferase